MASPAPLQPPLAEGIRRLGFRKWYERELLASHAHMALAVFAAVAMLASFEAFAGASPAEKLLNTFFVLLSAAVTLWALRRYTYLLMHAEQLANQASCPRCGVYGQLEPAAPAASAAPSAERLSEAPRLVPVSCKRCRFQWDLHED